MSDFVHLRVRSEYSILNSVLRIGDMAEWARKNNASAMCIMDDMSLSGTFDFCYRLGNIGVKPIIGINVFISDNVDSSRLPYLGLLAKSELGYQNLIKILYASYFKYGKNTHNQNYVHLNDVFANCDDIICITGGYNGILSHYFFENYLEKATDIANHLHDVFGDRLYIELTRHGRKNEQEVEDFLLNLAMNKNIPLVATNDVHFLRESNFTAHDIICCIRDGRYLVEKNRERLNHEYYFKSHSQMVELFDDIPEAITNTLQIAKRCSFTLKSRNPMLPSFSLTDGMTEIDELKKESYIGLANRLSKIQNANPKQYEERLDFELGIITRVGFSGYFLVVSDFVKWAKRNDIPVGPGRGSGAGSIVAWSLGITNVDPIEYGLLFERFLNPERISMPDFDIDFCQSRRDEVIDYVRNKYGKDMVANIITFGKLQAKAVLKDVGRVMQIPYGKVDEICKLIPFNPIEPVTLNTAISIDPQLQQQRLNDPDIQELIDISLDIEGLNRHTSTHAAGVIIGNNDLRNIVPIHKEQDSNIGIVGFGMKDSEKIGLVKFDFLGLKTLTIISHACELIKQHRNIDIDIDFIDINDEQTFEFLRGGKTKGIFQLETSIPRDALQKMHVDSINDIVAITSLNRPGPMEHIPSYIRRKMGQEEITYPHEILREILSPTYGIAIYQEQVMQIAQVMAGYTLGAADLLRRAIGKKIKTEMDQQRDIFIAGARNNQIDQDVAESVFALIEKFAGYGFNKSHAVSYSIISYQTAYLKTHFTIEFFVAMMNLDIHNTDKLNEIANDAKSNGIKIIPPDINRSDAKFIIEDNIIIYGIAGLKGIGMDMSKAIIEIRNIDGPFKDIFDFAKRCSNIFGKKQIENLIKSGSFDNLHSDRLQLINSLEIILRHANNEKSQTNEDQGSLFDISEVTSKIIPSLVQIQHDHKISDTQKMNMEFESIGFYLATHPLDPYKDHFSRLDITSSGELEEILHKTSSSSCSIRMAGVIVKIKQRFSKRGRFAFVHISDLDGIFETTIFNDDLITSRRNVLVEGQAIVAAINVKQDLESGTRITINDIQLIDDVASGSVNLIERSFNKDWQNRQTKKYPDNKTDRHALEFKTDNMVASYESQSDIDTHINTNDRIGTSITSIHDITLSTNISITKLDHMAIYILINHALIYIYQISMIKMIIHKLRQCEDTNGSMVVIKVASCKILLKNRYNLSIITSI